MAMNPWEGQGTTLNNNGGMSTPGQAPKGQVLSTITTLAAAFPSILCAINPKNCSTPVYYSDQPLPQQRQQPNWLLIGMGGFLIVLILILILKK